MPDTVLGAEMAVKKTKHETGKIPFLAWWLLSTGEKDNKEIE